MIEKRLEDAGADVRSRLNAIPIREFPGSSNLFAGLRWPAFAATLVVVLTVGIGLSLLMGNQQSPPHVTTPSGARCLTPPVTEQVGMLQDIVVIPQRLRAGDHAEISVKTGMAGAGYVWQCWDGSRWINTHFLYITTEGWHREEPETLPWNEEVFVELVGFFTPISLTFRVPDQPPGVYRILDRQPDGERWAMVIITDVDSELPPTMPPGGTCTPPPIEEHSRPFDHDLATAEVLPRKVLGGARVDLYISETPTAVDTGVIVYVPHAGSWQCWDGSGWVEMFTVTKWGEVLPPGSSIDIDGTYRGAYGELVVPDVEPGIYRVVERLVHPTGAELETWAMVEVVEDRPFTECPAALRGSEVDVEEALFPIILSSTSHSPGMTVGIDIPPPSTGSDAYRTDSAVVWQCWNGREWIDTHLLHKGWQTSYDTLQLPSVVGPYEGWHVGFLGLPLPHQAEVLIPDVPPGTYRIVATLWGPETRSDPEGIIRSYTLIEIVPN